MLPHKPTFQIFFTESNIRYLPKSEAAVHRCLQPFIEKRLFTSTFLPKLQAYSLKKTPPEMFLWNIFGSWLLLLNTIHFLCFLDLISKMFPPTLAFQSKQCESLVNSCFWKFKTISWFIADKSSDTSKKFLEIRSSRPAVFFKSFFL